MRSILLIALFIPQLVFGQINITDKSDKFANSFPLVSSQQATSIYYDVNDLELVTIAAELLITDIEKVTGKKPQAIAAKEKAKNALVIIGTIGNSKLIDQLISEKKLAVNDIQDQWERFTIQTLDNPFKGVSKALVIAGSDKRGTAYGVFTLSEAIGVSPWSWWADVPVTKRKALYIQNTVFTSKAPSVKYRGIFLNDEDWGLHPWAGKNTDPDIGGVGPNAYEKIFELVLRLKGNMVAPAMHEITEAFYSVPENAKVADEFGVMVTTSHCEPLLYNNAKEWDKKKQGEWNYVTNKAEIVKVLENRVEQAFANENIYTIALRGMHDEGMTGVSDDQKLRVLDEAVKDQRAILSKYITKPITSVPQIFVPYKEVLAIYEQGLELPDDVTIVWPDDNYGYLKKLSDKEEQKRKGGAGVYYHISYLGWPNDYLWLDSTNPSLMYSELQKAYALGADQYWLVNVGDIKSGEKSMQLFLDMAWDIDKFSFDNINHYQAEQLAAIFGQEYEQDLAYILDRYYYHGFSRKPEYMTWDYRWNSLFDYDEVKDTDFSFVNYNEAENRLAEYKTIATMAKDILAKLPQQLKAPFFELVYYPVKGASLYNHEMLIAQKNRWYAKQKRAATNALATEVANYHSELAALTLEYNNLLDGKWNGVMTAPGFLPEIQLPPTQLIDVPNTADIAIFVEGVASEDEALVLPQFNRRFKETHFFEIYNRGSVSAKWQATVSAPWIKLNVSSGVITNQDRVVVSIDWNLLPSDGIAEGEIRLSDGKNTKNIHVSALDPVALSPIDLSKLYIENNGVISISPSAFHRKTEHGDIRFTVIDGLGYSNSSLQLGNAKFDSGEDSYVEYDFYTAKAGEATIYTYMLPLFAKDKEHGTRYGIQVDGLAYAIHSNDVKEYSKEWADNVIRNTAINKISVSLDKPGKHTLKVYVVDPGMIMQKIDIDLGGLKASYMGASVSKI